MSISPPQEQLWWNEPIPRSELIWILIAFIWGLIMFFAMVFWHIEGEQNLSNEAYKTSPEAFSAKAEAMVAKYRVRDEANIPVVHPVPGEDIYLIGRLWQWWPILELEKNQTYRLHISSMDWMHGFSLQPVNINLQIIPGYDMVLTVTPNEAGTLGIVCNEFCGIGHHTMIGRLYVVDKQGI